MWHKGDSKIRALNGQSLANLISLAGPVLNNQARALPGVRQKTNNRSAVHHGE
jgi:hypothetical protein